MVEPKEVIYNRGSSEYREDGMILSPPFFGVLDGVSEPYSPSYPPQIFSGGISGGALVSRIVERQFARMSPHFSTYQAVLEANKAVWRKQRRRGATLDGGQLAGVSFAVAKVAGDWITIVQGCDAFALWVTRDGRVEMTRAQNEVSETFLNDKIDELMQEVANERGLDLEAINDKARDDIRAEVFDRFYSTLVATRREYVNNPTLRDGYGLLNGQPELEMKWFNLNLPREKVQTLLLFTDGIIPWKAVKDHPVEDVADIVYLNYRDGGLPNLLAQAREFEEKTKTTHYTDYAEATAIAIEF